MSNNIAGTTDQPKHRHIWRLLKLCVVAGVIAIGTYQTMLKPQDINDSSTQNLPVVMNSPAAEALKTLAIKGRAAKTNYSRSQFGDGWLTQGGCDTRNRILARDMTAITFVPTMDVMVCKVATGTLSDPYTGTTIQFVRGETTSDDVQIDHVVALSDAWQKGAQQLTPEQRIALANDPLELLAVDGAANQQKSDGDAATWLPDNKVFRCSYVARQIAVKKKYALWITRSEYDAMTKILNTCPGQLLPA